jgi:ribosomal protein S18 acetylase RimI-like enzyme
MIHLRQMQASEFPDFIEYFVPDYAAEISSNFDEELGVARERAEREVKADLGLGVATPGQVLLCIVKDSNESNSPVGYLWCKPDEAGRSVFVSDFCILPSHRGNGYAKSALKALEAMFAETGHREIRLRVASDNEKARHLYLAVGFRVTGMNMSKSIDKA